MRYHTTIEGLTLAVDTDTVPATVTVTDDATNQSVTVRSYQLGAQKILRRALSDLSDAFTKQEGKRQKELAERGVPSAP